MATRYQEQATQQLAPVYDQQIQGLQGQVPAIQNLYQTLTGALQQQNQMQLNTGVQNIMEDASARGVLRSTLPVDARMNLTGQLGAALNTSLGNLGLQQQQQIGDIQGRIGGLQVDRANQIASLARGLETQDLERQRLAEQQRQFDLQQAQEMKIAQMQAAAQRTAGGGGGGGTVSNQELFASQLAMAAGSDGNVDPGTYNALKKQYVSAGYGSYKDFHDKFWSFANDSHWWDYR